jgi:hypothetical protein
MLYFKYLHVHYNFGWKLEVSFNNIEYYFRLPASVFQSIIHPLLRRNPLKLFCVVMEISSLL